MRTPRVLAFGSLALDLRDERLWRGEDALRLTNKAFAVLRYLVESAEQLVTQEALLETVREHHSILKPYTGGAIGSSRRARPAASP